MNTPDPLQTCRQELEQVTKEFEEFAYIVSHDLKAPLRAILNLASWIEDDLGTDLTDDVQQHITLLRARATRMEKMINALLAYSRATRTDLTIKETDCRKIFEELAAAETDKKINLSLPESLPVFETYIEKFRLVFKNLFENAAKFAVKSEVAITISVTENEQFYNFSVTDDGPGITPEALPNIFTMFYTAQPKDKFESTGAGLSIVKKNLQFVGGNIAIHSGTGTNVLVNWPKKSLQQ